MLILFLMFYLQQGGPAISLTSSNSNDPATAGYFTLSWEAADASHFELQEAKHESFSEPVLLYKGSDTATTITGRKNGVYYFRSRAFDAQAQPGPWSEVVAVTVEHHSLQRAWFFFGIGALVFIGSLLTILLGGPAEVKEGLS